MNEEERAALQAAIEEQIEKLKQDIERLKDETKPVSPDNAIGRLTRMEAINTKSISEANLRKAKMKLAQLEKTLPRLEDEEFGLCTVCEEPIPPKRIMLMPETTRCVACAEGRGRRR